MANPKARAWSLDMRIERANRWPMVPRWAVLIVASYLVLIGLHEWLGPLTVAEVGPLCLFRRLTGWPCPGCGSTRMVLAVLDGRFGEATLHNPLLFAAAMVALALLVVRIGLGRRVVWLTSPRSVRLFTLAIVLSVLGNWAYLLVVR